MYSVIESLNPWWVGGFALAAVGLVATVRSGRRSAHKAAVQAQQVTRMTGNAVRVMVTMLVLVAIQWAVLSNTRDPATWAVALSVPAFFAAASLVRLLSVTTEIQPVYMKRGGRR